MILILSSLISLIIKVRRIKNTILLLNVIMYKYLVKYIILLYLLLIIFYFYLIVKEETIIQFR